MTGFGEFTTACPGHHRHKWTPPNTPGRECENCGIAAREHFDAATRARTEFFGTLRAPASAHGKAVKK